MLYCTTLTGSRQAPSVNGLYLALFSATKVGHLRRETPRFPPLRGATQQTDAGAGRLHMQREYNTSMLRCRRPGTGRFYYDIHKKE